jgi:hypothetical protein
MHLLRALRRANSPTPSVAFLALLLTLPTAVRAAAPAAADFRPDPLSVQREGPAYRYPQAGWIVLHVEGEPYERGYQHGKLLAPEIAATVRCCATLQGPKAPAEAWKLTRTLVNALFLRRYKEEYLKEMQGIADGAAAAGARFDNRPIDLVDVAALNSWMEFGTLDGALQATATGLEGARFPHEQPRAGVKEPMGHCSAFAATGPATADGKVVIGHITMFGLYASNYFNVWLDVQPARGHRLLMQSYPGGIQSGMDYYQNDAGLVVVETTIHQTKFDVTGMALASRIREALQYADTIDRAVAILAEGNNGLYTNEWLLADTKTNEIAMFELGTHKTRLWRSSKNEWFGGTKGFYWGCNNVKDLEVRLETVAAVDGRPANVVFHPSDRDKTWLRLYKEHFGKIDVGFGKLAFTTPPVAAYHSLDAKFTTTDLAKDLKSWALFGPPLGRTWQPTRQERQLYPDIQPLVSNPWTVLHGQPPRKEATTLAARDLGFPRQQAAAEERPTRRGQAPANRPAWHGTLLPQTDADTWLAAAFADYEKIVAQEHNPRDRTDGERRAASDREARALPLFGYRSQYLAAARVAGDLPLAKTHGDLADDAWYRIAAGKGVLVLHELRRSMGDGAFCDMMDAFGRDNAGKPVTAAQFQAHVEKWLGGGQGAFFDPLLNGTGLPLYRLGKVASTPAKSGYRVSVEILREGTWPRSRLDVTVETAKGEVTKSVVVEGDRASLVVETSDAPRRVVVDKYGQTAKANGGAYAVPSFGADLGDTLIVYGTRDEAPANREAAEALQRAIVESGSNVTVPLKSDAEVSDADLQSHHLLLIGRPDSNAVVARCRGGLPVEFGSRSFVVSGEAYAHAGSAVVAAGESPWNKRYAVVVVAGLSAAATREAAPRVVRAAPAEVLVLAHGDRPRGLVVPARELVREMAAR